MGNGGTVCYSCCACAVRSPIVSVCSFRARSTHAVRLPLIALGRSSDRTVAVQSQYTHATLDRAQTEYSSSATMAIAGRSYCDHSTSCASADRQQTEYPAIKKSQCGILNISKFRSATKMATKTIRRLVRPTMTTLRPYWDRSKTLLRSHAIWSKNWSQYGRSLGVTGV